VTSPTFSILQGPDGIDGLAVHSKDTVAANAPVAGRPIRVGWLVEAGFGPVDPEVASAVASVANLLRSLGCEVEAVRIPAFEKNNYFDTALVLYGAELGRYIPPFVGDRLADLHFIGKIYATLPPTPIGITLRPNDK
jgi:aspartyl-tRNA(Asn)/glutamyl-tRNA(Gln) amidotransferase subunit A